MCRLPYELRYMLITYIVWVYIGRDARLLAVTNDEVREKHVQAELQVTALY